MPFFAEYADGVVVAAQAADHGAAVLRGFLERLFIDISAGGGNRNQRQLHVRIFGDARFAGVSEPEFEIAGIIRNLNRIREFAPVVTAFVAAARRIIFAGSLDIIGNDLECPGEILPLDHGLHGHEPSAQF